MRTIKFRAWENGKMYYQVRCGGEFDGMPTAPTVWSEPHGDWIHLTGQPYTKVMQYTGLHDKNGREIYEGDIVKIIDEDDAENYNVCTVRWSGGAFQVDVSGINSDYDYTAIGWVEYAEIEVIGNIYEHPELLK